MSTRRRLLGLATLAGIGALVIARAGPVVERGRRRLRTSSAPSVGGYEWLADRLLGGYYDAIAADCAVALDGLAAPTVLEIGPGPGHLAERLHALVPGLRWTGLDVDDGMLAAAERRLAAAGVGADGRMTFTHGDVAAIPFPDVAFDLVVSSLSAHHWGDAAAGFREIRRVLRPGATALVYDIPSWWGHIEMGSRGIDAAEGLFATCRASRFRGVGPVTLVTRLELAA